MGIIQFEKQKEKRVKKSEQKLRNLWDIPEWTNISIVGFPEREKREGMAERMFGEIMASNLPNLLKDMNINIQEA